jgi:DNA repair protein RecO (recombination protein O)
VIRKTEGIVLRTLKHQDANLITTLYTEEYGLMSFIITGYRSTRSRRNHSYFQPLSIVEVVFQQRPNRDLHRVSESKVAYLLQEGQTHPVKLSLGLAMIEIFYDTVKEEEPQAELYRFLREVIVRLDQAETRLIQLFLYFLVHLTRFLGFFPYDASEEAAHLTFDPVQGVLLPEHPGLEAASLLRYFMYADLSELPAPYSCQQITFSQEEKRQLIRLIFDYYRTHITGFRYPQTMRVFAEIFG